MNHVLTNLLDEYKRHLMKAITRLEYSLAKVRKLGSEVASLSDDDLETWESFSSRFSRASDLFITKYLRTHLLLNDPAYTGTLIDSLNEAEKIKFISSAKVWYRIRELRNKEAHEYTEETLSVFFKEIRDLAPQILELKDRLP